MTKAEPILWIIIPCYNEEAVLPITAPLFLQKLSDLIKGGRISPESRILFVNDGSKDKTWEIFSSLAAFVRLPFSRIVNIKLFRINSLSVSIYLYLIME